ncbi:MAG: LysR family transcriptional regulator [Pseudoflavonifractor sp.]|nr:LysR family transcriptional regulator [Pseudoflavonifractor sp.]
MKIRTLEYFVTLAESKSINEAAQKLYIAQPSPTKALHLLEGELNVQLFYRFSSGIFLTEAGKKILPEARQVVAYYYGWKSMAKETSLKQIDIYTYASFPDFLFPDLLLQFRKIHPGLAINYTTSFEPEAYISRSTQEPTIALLVCQEGEECEKLAKLQGNAPIELLDGEYRCLVNKNSPLAQKKSVSLEDLRDYYLAFPTINNNIEQIGFISSMLQLIIASNSNKKIVGVESVNNVISLVNREPDTYALSYYPALKRYKEAGQVNLVDIPFHNFPSKGKLYMFYSMKACGQHPVLRELIQAIHDTAERFLSDVE